ncbi:unnamed protein product [Owenia fusiformis]|uniref:Rap-GAP domain-containing protein n=1 Tax=Owenia fusiformis TaxID=6347 RepID=A0A8S4PNL5_OWEFU|nr:unnamed protein product [Owenia fusiformis]
MAKAPAKSDESFSSKFKNLLRIGSGKSPVLQNVQVKPQTKEIIITPELLKEISSESPANNRLKTIQALTEVANTKRLEDNAPQVLWLNIQDLVQPQVPRESRLIALKFLQALIKGQYKHLGLLRGHFFKVLRSHTLFEDLNERLDIFISLTDNGRDIELLEEDIGAYLQQFMQEVMSSARVPDYMQLLINVVKFNAAYLDENVVSGLVQHTCVLLNRTKSEADLDQCLKVLDVVLCYSYLPPASLFHFITCLCRTVNVEKFCQPSWTLMRKLLGTHLGHSGVYSMCCILQDQNHLGDYTLLRGAVFFIGMALWGSMKVKSLKHTPASVLPSFLKSMDSKHDVVAYEVVLSTQRLVKKYGKDLPYGTWDQIFEIVKSLIQHVEDNPSCESTIIENLHEVITGIEELFENNQFTGSKPKLFNIIESCANQREERSILLLVSYKAKSLHPACNDWMLHLYDLVERFFKFEARTAVRVKTLNVLSCVLSANRHMYEDDLVEMVVLPLLSQIDTDMDAEVRNVAVQLLVDLAMTCETQKCLDMISIIEKVINKPPSKPESGTSQLATTLSEEPLIKDKKTAAIGLLNIFKAKLSQLPCGIPCKVFEVLTSHLKIHYKKVSTSESLTDYEIDAQWLTTTLCEIRCKIFECFLDMRADEEYRLGMIDDKNKVTYSPYVICDYRMDNAEPRHSNSSSPTTSPLPQQKDITVIPFNDAFKAIVRCLDHEVDWNVLKLVLEKLPLLLQNKTLILSGQAYIDHFCKRVCAMVGDRRHTMLQDALINTPPGFLKSDFHACVLPVLTCLVSYHRYLDKQQQKTLIRCLEFGLVSKCARLCLAALTVCTLEMQDAMMRLLPSVLVRMSQISATVAMATQLLEFLSNLIRVPKLYANFVEEQYMSVFAIALPYTNPFKFSHYAVSLAHQVIALWFLKCRLPFRRDFVQFIMKGLKANVLRQFDETSKQHIAQYDHIRSSGLNQDSSGRRRIGSGSSFSEWSKKRQKRLQQQPNLEPVKLMSPAPSPSPLCDDSMLTFHKELTETCIDMMARYTFSTITTMPKRSDVTEFLLDGGQSQTWLLGNRLITITTSGGGTKVGKSGVCEKCNSLMMVHMKKQHENLQRSSSVSTSNESLAGRRRRHKSAAVRTLSSVEPLQSLNLSQDDMFLQRQQTDDAGFSQSDTNVIQRKVSMQTTHTTHSLEDTPDSLSNSDAQLNMLKELNRANNSTSEIQPGFNPHLCNCWCQSWAEVHIRRPTGNISWVMRLQNDPNTLTGSPEVSLADLSSLFMPTPEKSSKMISHLTRLEKIDTESLDGNKYDAMHEDYFASSVPSTPLPKASISEFSDLSLLSQQSLELQSDVTDDVYAQSVTPSTSLNVEKTEEGEDVETEAHGNTDAPNVISQNDEPQNDDQNNDIEYKPFRRSSSSPNVQSFFSTSVEAQMSVEDRESTLSELKQFADKEIKRPQPRMLKPTLGSPFQPVRKQTEKTIDPKVTTNGQAEFEQRVSSDVKVDRKGDVEVGKEVGADSVQFTLRNEEKSQENGQLDKEQRQNGKDAIKTRKGENIESKAKADSTLDSLGQPNSKSQQSLGIPSSESRNVTKTDLDSSSPFQAKNVIPKNRTPELSKNVSEIEHSIDTTAKCDKDNVMDTNSSTSNGQNAISSSQKELNKTRLPRLRNDLILSADHTSHDRANHLEGLAKNSENLSRNRDSVSRSRGHTISVMPQTPGKGPERTVLGSKDAVKSGISPSFVFLQLYHSSEFGSELDRPVLLSTTDVQLNRTIKNLDRIYPYNTHKIGVLYVGPDQVNDEIAILSNQCGCGSTRYGQFLASLGQLLRLEDCNPEFTYTGGLDTRDGKDGQFAYSWQDDIMQVVFHVATLMPRKDSDTKCVGKKLHIGNDYVTIVYNNSQESYQIGTIKGQFNYVNIVIQPLDHASNAVTVQTAQDITSIIGHTDTKIVSDQHLAVLVRQMAIHADLASVILQRQKSMPKDPYASNWLERLRKIKHLRSKLLQDGAKSPTSSPSKSHHGMDDFTDFV